MELNPQQTKKFPIKIPDYIYKDNKGFVYVIKIDNYIKIGSTKSLERRLSFYKTFPPFNYELILASEVYDMKFYERAMQYYFIEFQEKGEWFNIEIMGDDVYKQVKYYIQEITNKLSKIINKNE
jgi:hypothetical protein